mmetsp:Transcript_88758/g.248365  ORF Transcript_88758/g.248365 Transcript_88758/m.248365 type:complete len:94 (+) Transcript_88758:192-473(+)
MPKSSDSLPNGIDGSPTQSTLWISQHCMSIISLSRFLVSQNFIGKLNPLPLFSHIIQIIAFTGQNISMSDTIWVVSPGKRNISLSNFGSLCIS